MIQIQKTGANHLTLRSLQPYDQPSTIRRLDSREAGCAVGGKTSPSVRPWVARGNRTPDAPAPATNRNHRLRDLADGKFLRRATLFRNQDLRSTEWCETFQLQKFDSRGATSFGRGKARNALPSRWLDRPQH